MSGVGVGAGKKTDEMEADGDVNLPESDVMKGYVNTIR
jgi:hypothetical protein